LLNDQSLWYRLFLLFTLYLGIGIDKIAPKKVYTSEALNFTPEDKGCHGYTVLFLRISVV